ncbi:Tim44 domain-containing protein [Legionella septentrionalis]|uniref:Tim44 domain-containing protein n=1 Tax=Legionella septentrionalis TaxID=2498109 RepID=A0A3S0XG87_9GAMM|nr:Tim44-like domain-containing protein [Legionella septentrionalis]RUQ88026.1 Tim44 domain-containing protein [Legionella septentrionalis]
MYKFFAYFLIVLLSFGLTMNEAAAKRFGGGRSFGVQRSHSSFSHSAPKNTKPLGQRSNSSRWGGMLGGLLIGGLLASLFMQHGFASGLVTWAILGLLGLLIFNFFRKRQTLNYQTASQAFGRGQTRNDYRQEPYFADETQDFDTESFLREAKVMFIRLQNAYDQKNMQDLTAFTVPEVFAEIKMQLDERGDEPNVTEIGTLNAQLLDVTKQPDGMMISVRFTGLIKENDASIPLNEIWHFRKFTHSSQWVVGGIQQEMETGQTY